MVIRRTSFFSYDLFEMFKQWLLLSNRFDMFLWSFIHFMCVQVYILEVIMAHLHLYHVDIADQLVRILYIFFTSWEAHLPTKNVISDYPEDMARIQSQHLHFHLLLPFLCFEVLEIVGNSSGLCVYGSLQVNLRLFWILSPIEVNLKLWMHTWFVFFIMGYLFFCT